MGAGALRILADAVLVLHVAIVLFVAGGMVLIVLGGVRRWGGGRNLWFRLAHLGAIGFVVAESWFGIVCPLTTLEVWLRSRAGQLAYQGDFVAHWLGRLLFYQAEPWVFTVVYTAFGALVLAGWLWCPPKK